jgi:hypothetical protein
VQALERKSKLKKIIQITEMVGKYSEDGRKLYPKLRFNYGPLRNRDIRKYINRCNNNIIIINIIGSIVISNIIKIVIIM